MSPIIRKEEKKVVAQQRIIDDMAKSGIANFSNLSDNFLIIFSVHLVGLANFVSRKY